MNKRTYLAAHIIGSCKESTAILGMEAADFRQQSPNGTGARSWALPVIADDVAVSKHVAVPEVQSVSLCEE